MSEPTLQARLGRRLAEIEGKYAPPPLPRLAAGVVQLSELYTRRRDALTREVPGPVHLPARLHFFLPRDVGKVTAALRTLACEGWAPSNTHPRMLDLGAGLGASTLGAADFFADRPDVVSLQVEAWDTDAVALDAMRHVVGHAPELGLMPIELDVHVGKLRDRAHAGHFDLIVLGLVLNELADGVDVRARLLTRLSKLLVPGGVLLAIEPALREPSRALMAVRDIIAASPTPPHVVGPCVHGGACPLLERQRDWCHAELREDLCPELARIATAAGLRRSRLTYSWLALSNDMKWADDRLARVVSGPLPSKGKLELDVCHAGGLTRLMRIDREARPETAVIERVGRGDLLRVVEGEWTPGRMRLRPRTAVLDDPTE